MTNMDRLRICSSRSVWRDSTGTRRFDPLVSCSRGGRLTHEATEAMWSSHLLKCQLWSALPDSNCLLVACLTSQQQASVSQGRICSDNLTCCHTEIEVADQTFLLTQSQYTDTGPSSPSADPIMPGAWQSSHWSAILSHWYDSTPKNPAQAGFEPGIFRSRGGRLTTRPTRRSLEADALPTKPRRRCGMVTFSCVS